MNDVFYGLSGSEKTVTAGNTITGTKTIKNKTNKSSYNPKTNYGYVELVDNYEPSDDPCDFCIHKNESGYTTTTGTISNLGFKMSIDICSTCKHKKKKKDTPSIPTYPSWPNVVYNGSITSTGCNAVKDYSDK